jgi:hypothetical protein
VCAVLWICPSLSHKPSIHPYPPPTHPPSSSSPPLLINLSDLPWLVDVLGGKFGQLREILPDVGALLLLLLLLIDVGGVDERALLWIDCIVGSVCVGGGCHWWGLLLVDGCPPTRRPSFPSVLPSFRPSFLPSVRFDLPVSLTYYAIRALSVFCPKATGE